MQFLFGCAGMADQPAQPSAHADPALRQAREPETGTIAAPSGLAARRGLGGDRTGHLLPITATSPGRVLPPEAVIWPRHSHASRHAGPDGPGSGSARCPREKRARLAELQLIGGELQHIGAVLSLQAPAGRGRRRRYCRRPPPCGRRSCQHVGAAARWSWTCRWCR